MLSWQLTAPIYRHLALGWSCAHHALNTRQRTFHSPAGPHVNWHALCILVQILSQPGNCCTWMPRLLNYLITLLEFQNNTFWSAWYLKLLQLFRWITLFVSWHLDIVFASETKKAMQHCLLILSHCNLWHRMHSHIKSSSVFSVKDNNEMSSRLPQSQQAQ